MKNKSKLPKLVFIILALSMIALIFVTTISISADDEYTCEELENLVNVWQDYYDGCEVYGNYDWCVEARQRLLYYEELYDEQGCGITVTPCKTLFYYEEMNNQYSVDNSPYYVWKIYSEETDEIMFCIEPSATMLDCHDDYYTVSADDLSTEDIIRISLAAMFYLEEPSNTHYVAAHQIEQV